MVNYCQSLVFDHPHLSCNDLCDWWLFQEIFFYYYFQKQPYADVLQTPVNRNFVIFTRKHLCWSLFLIKLQALWPAILLQPDLKRDFNTGDSCENCNCYEQLFLWNTSSGCFCQYDKVTVQWWTASADLFFLIKNKIYVMVSTTKVCKSGQSMLFTHY